MLTAPSPAIAHFSHWSKADHGTRHQHAEEILNLKLGDTIASDAAEDLVVMLHAG